MSADAAGSAQGAGHGTSAHDGAAEGLPAGVTLQALADRVYRLMVAEIRLERSRGTSSSRRRGE